MTRETAIEKAKELIKETKPGIELWRIDTVAQLMVDFYLKMIKSDKQALIKAGTDFHENYHLKQKGKWGTDNQLKDLVEFMADLKMVEQEKTTAIEFSEWCSHNNWYYWIGERIWRKMGLDSKTTAELFEMFKKREEK